MKDCGSKIEKRSPSLGLRAACCRFPRASLLARSQSPALAQRKALQSCVLRHQVLSLSLVPLPLITSHFSLLTSHFSLLTSHFSLLTSHFFSCVLRLASPSLESSPHGRLHPPKTLPSHVPHPQPRHEAGTGPAFHAPRPRLSLHGERTEKQVTARQTRPRPAEIPRRHLRPRLLLAWA